MSCINAVSPLTPVGCLPQGHGKTSEARSSIYKHQKPLGTQGLGDISSSILARPRGPVFKGFLKFHSENCSLKYIV